MERGLQGEKLYPRQLGESWGSQLGVFWSIICFSRLNNV